MGAGDQLAGAKWFGDVVIGAQFQALDNVVFLTAHCEENDRGVRLLPDAPADRKAVKPGHVDVQHDQVGLFLCPSLQGHLAIISQGYLEPFAPQGKGQHIGQHTIIIND
jgi:hypothetical protein